jgi:hypothetical protein
VSAGAAARIRCAAGEEAGAGGTVLVSVRCRGGMPALLAVLGGVLPVDVRARAIKEGQ